MYTIYVVFVRYNAGQVSLEMMTMYASKNAYKDHFVKSLSSNETLETDFIYEEVDATIINSMQSRALPPEPNSATISLHTHNQSIEAGRVPSVSIPPTHHDQEDYAIPSPSHPGSVHLLTPPSSTSSLMSNSAPGLDQVDCPTRTLADSREQEVISFDVGMYEYPRESRKAGSSLSLPRCVNDMDGYAAITRDRRIKSTTFRPSFPIVEMAQEYEAEKPPQDYEVPISSVSSTDDIEVFISMQNTQQNSQSEQKPPQEYEVPISSVSSINDLFCNPAATQQSVLDSTRQDNDPQDYEIPVSSVSITDYNGALLPATQEQQSVLVSTDLGEYVKLSDDKIKGCASVDPDVCEVKLTQELEVLISVSDNDDESCASQELTLDKLGYTYAEVNKKKKKTTSMKTDETTDCTVYYNVNGSPKTDNKCYHWYENVDVGCKSVNDTPPNKT